jgi:hypothetical protein
MTMMVTTKNIDFQYVNFDNSKKHGYRLTAFVEYKLTAEIVEFTHEKIKDIEDAFWEINTCVEKFAVMYDGSKTIKLFVPMKNSIASMLEAGIAIGEFMQFIDAGELIDYISVTPGVEYYEDYLPYCYTSLE